MSGWIWREEQLMHEEKQFLTYNQQMRRLRNEKGIICDGSSDKRILVRFGYFNIVNGYKTPFVSNTDRSGKHHYISGTSISQLYSVKQFDDYLRMLLLKYITQVEEEVRTLTAYKFDECNDRGKTPWYDIEAYSPRATLQNKMNAISRAYKEMSDSHLDYVSFYMNNHKQIPTWIMIKAINFSTFISIIKYSKADVSHSLCYLYSMVDSEGRPDVKLLIGSLHWMRIIRNSCAHNERVYCLSRETDQHGQGGRIKESYLKALRPSYARDQAQKVIDLIIYLKYYLPASEFKVLIKDLKEAFRRLQASIHPSAFDYIRGQTGLKDLEDLDKILRLPKNPIDYNKFEQNTICAFEQKNN